MRLEDGGVALRPLVEADAAPLAAAARDQLAPYSIELRGARRDVYVYALLAEDL